jgi:hypothetical protein
MTVFSVLRIDHFEPNCLITRRNRLDPYMVPLPPSGVDLPQPSRITDEAVFERGPVPPHHDPLVARVCVDSRHETLGPLRDPGEFLRRADATADEVLETERAGVHRDPVSARMDLAW